MPKVLLVFHRFPHRKRSDVHSFKGREIEVRLAAVLTKDEPTTQLLVQPRDRTTHFSSFASNCGTSVPLQPFSWHVFAACFVLVVASDSFHRQWTHFYGLVAEPTVPNPIADSLAGGKRIELNSTQGRFSERYLCSVIATNHAFLLVPIDVPDHSLHASNSCSSRNTQPPFPFARRENGQSAFAKPGPAHPESEGPLLQPRRLAELHDPGPTGSGRNYVFRILGCFGWTSDRRLHINGTGKLRAGSE